MQRHGQVALAILGLLAFILRHSFFCKDVKKLCSEVPSGLVMLFPYQCVWFVWFVFVGMWTAYDNAFFITSPPPPPGGPGGGGGVCHGGEAE